MSHEPRPHAALHPPLGEPVVAKDPAADPSADPSVTLKESRVVSAFISGLSGATLLGFRFSQGLYRVTVRIGAHTQTLEHRDLIGALANVQTLHDHLTTTNQERAA